MISGYHIVAVFPAGAITIPALIGLIGAQVNLPIMTRKAVHHKNQLMVNPECASSLAA